MAPLTLTQQRIKEETTKALIEINKFNKKHKKEEHYLQCQIVNYLRANGYLVFAIANGGSRNAIEGANLKKEGVLAGIADLQVLLNNGKSLFLEVKTEKGKQQQTQKNFEERCKQLGHNYHVVRSVEDVINVLQTQITPTKQEYKICKICHTPTLINELDKDGICRYCK